MKSPQPAVCANEACGNNANGRVTLVCSHCGRCADCTLHTDCDAPETVRGRPDFRVPLWQTIALGLKWRQQIRERFV